MRNLTKKENGKYVLYNDISILQFFIRSMHSPFVDEFAEDCDNLGNRPPKQRIDFAKYGRRVEGEKEKKEVNEEEEEETRSTDSLPPDIYCGIVNNLNQKWVLNLNI